MAAPVKTIVDNIELARRRLSDKAAAQEHHERLKREAEAERQRKADVEREEIGVRLERTRLALGRRYESCSLENYHATIAGQQEVKRTLEGYQRSVEQGEIPSFALVGPCGTGKDHLLAAMMLHAVEHGRAVQWLSGWRIPSAVERYELMTASRLRAQWPDVVAISDPIAQDQLYPSHKPALLTLIDMLYRDDVPLWIAMNARNRTEALERFGGQVIDRLTDATGRLWCDWESYRCRERT